MLIASAGLRKVFGEGLLCFWADNFFQKFSGGTHCNKKKRI